MMSILVSLTVMLSLLDLGQVEQRFSIVDFDATFRVTGSVLCDGAPCPDAVVVSLIDVGLDDSRKRDGRLIGSAKPPVGPAFEVGGAYLWGRQLREGEKVDTNAAAVEVVVVGTDCHGAKKLRLADFEHVHHGYQVDIGAVNCRRD